MIRHADGEDLPYKFKRLNSDGTLTRCLISGPELRETARLSRNGKQTQEWPYRRSVEKVAALQRSTLAVMSGRGARAVLAPPCHLRDTARMPSACGGDAERPGVDQGRHPFRKSLLAKGGSSYRVKHILNVELMRV